MKCLRTEAFPRKIMTIAFTSAMLLQAHNSFAEDEMEGSSLDHAQILHWLSQPENHEGARVTEHSSDESKTRIVIEISNPDKSTSQATPTDAPEPLPYLLPDKDDTNLVSLPVTPLAPPSITTVETDLATNAEVHPAQQAHPHFHPMMPVAMPPDRAVVEVEPDAPRVQLNSYAATRVNGGEAELAPAITPHAVHNAHLAMKTTGDTLDERMSSQRTGIDRGRTLSAQGMWIQYGYNKARQDVRDAVPGYQAKTNGFTIGTDAALEHNRDIRSGVAYTYAKGRVNGENGTNNRINTDTNIFSIYSSSWENDYFLDGRISYAFGKNKGQRTVADNHIDASYRSRVWGLGLRGGYQFALGELWYCQPRVAFNYYTIDTDDYSESARDPDQVFPTFDQVSNGRYNTLELGAGVGLLSAFAATKNTIIKPELGIMAFHDFKKDPVEVTAHFAAGGESFLIHGAQRNRNRYQAEAALNLDVSANTIFALSYSYNWASQFKADSFIARVRYEF